MGFFDGILGSRAVQFQSGSASSNAIELTKRHATVSLTRQGAVHGNLRVNLSWRMRTSDIGGRSGQSGQLFRHPFKLFKPDMVQAHTQGMVNVDLDMGCLYELADGTRGAVQPLGNLLGDLNDPPYVKLSGDDRFGSGSGRPSTSTSTTPTRSSGCWSSSTSTTRPRPSTGRTPWSPSTP